jgi:hypothetical protein
MFTSKPQHDMHMYMVIYLFYYFIWIIIYFIIIYIFLPILGFTNPTPLNRNLVLEISKKRDTKGLVCNSAFSL